MKDEKVRALLRFIQTDEPGEDDFSKRLCEFVARVKKNEKFRKQKKRPPKVERPPKHASSNLTLA